MRRQDIWLGYSDQSQKRLERIGGKEEIAMSIITISYGNSGVRENIADRVASILGYESVGREVIETASKRFNVLESKLSHTIHHAPSFFELSEHTRIRNVSYILAAAAEYLLKDNLVYHGPAGHIIAQDISHILKAHLQTSTEARIQFTIDRENISREKAEKLVAREEAEREKWASMVFGLDDSDPKLYDLTINDSHTNMDEALSLITTAIKDRKYQPMTFSIQRAKNKELSYRIKALLIDLDPEIQVHCEEGKVIVNTKAHRRSQQKNMDLIKERVEALPDVKQVEIDMKDDLFERLAESMR